MSEQKYIHTLTLTFFGEDNDCDLVLDKVLDLMDSWYPQSYFTSGTSSIPITDEEFAAEVGEED